MAARGRSNQAAMQEGNHCSRSHPRCTAPALCLAAASIDKDLSWSERHVSSSFNPSSPVPVVVSARRHQRPRMHLLWEVTGTSWSHRACCSCPVYFMGINCYGKSLSSRGVQCQFVSSCTRQHKQLSIFSAHSKMETQAWECVHAL